ncbi:MAG: glycerophosphodiester phosphodiesterase family protein [Lysobacterales bacterium]
MPNAVPESIPRLMAHRGDTALFPENTLESIQAAGEAGITIIEFDVQLTRDRVPVILHDDNLQRTAGIKQSIFTLDVAQATAIRVSDRQRFGNRFTNIHLSALVTAVALLKQHPDWTYFVEIKRESLKHFGTAVVVEQVLSVLTPVVEQCVVISFDYQCLQEVQRRSGCRVGWVLRHWNQHSYKKAGELDPKFLIVNYTRLPEAGIPLWQGNWQWVCYEVNDAGLARHLVRRGVDIISSMAAPDLLKKLQADPASEDADG